MLFDSFVGKVVKFFQDEDFEHEYDIVGFSSGVGASFFLSDFLESRAKAFPWDEGVEFRQEVVELLNLAEDVFGVEKGRRTMQHGRENEKNEYKKNTFFLNPVETGDF